MKDLIERADALAAIALGDTVNQLQAKIRAIPRARLIATERDALARTALDALARAEKAEERAYALAVAIMGGEDAPGYADSIPTEQLVDLHREDRWYYQNAERTALAEVERLREANGRLRAMFRVNMLRLVSDISHADIDILLDGDARAAIGDKGDEE